jgi:hypothetical protein
LILSTLNPRGVRRRAIMDYVSGLCRKGMAILFISSDCQKYCGNRLSSHVTGRVCRTCGERRQLGQSDRGESHEAATHLFVRTAPSMRHPAGATVAASLALLQ